MRVRVMVTVRERAGVRFKICCYQQTSSVELVCRGSNPIVVRARGEG